MGKLDGKIIVITGSTRGLGLAIARACVAEGAKVVVSSRTREAVEESVATLRSAGGQASGQPCDVSDLAQVEALAEHARETWGGFHVWINNAGISPAYGPTMHVPPEAFVNATRTNILGTYYGSLVALRDFLPRHSGKLINLLGRGDRGRPVPLQNAYASSKAWVRSFTLTMAKEYRDTGVGIFAFNPGMMSTDLLTRLEAVRGYEEQLKVMPTIIRMWAYPPEVPARRVVWLASNATNGKTGLEVHLMGPVMMLEGAVKEGLRRLLRRPAPEMVVEVEAIPPALPLSSEAGA